MNASNRQKKLLTFFEVPFYPRISAGAAGWEISALMESTERRELWRRYLFLTNDFDSDSDQLRPFDRAALEAVVIPEDWNASAALEQFRSEVVGAEMADGSPYDEPQPDIQIPGRTFMFTGNFTFGSREECQAVVVAKGGSAPAQKSVSHSIDYLVVGSKGSKAWKRGSYGNKIEAAILARREYGSPAIVSEDHWLRYLKMG